MVFDRYVEIVALSSQFKTNQKHGDALKETPSEVAVTKSWYVGTCRESTGAALLLILASFVYRNV